MFGHIYTHSHTHTPTFDVVNITLCTFSSTTDKMNLCNGCVNSTLIGGDFNMRETNYEVSVLGLIFLVLS